MGGKGQICAYVKSTRRGGWEGRIGEKGDGLLAQRYRCCFFLRFLDLVGGIGVVIEEWKENFEVVLRVCDTL